MATATAADYSTTTVANGLYYPLSGNPSGFLTSAPVTSVAGKTGVVTLVAADVSGAVTTAAANTYTAGAKQTVSHSSTTAGLNVGPVAGDPSSLANGDVWLNSTTNALNARVNGGTHQLNTIKAWVNFNGTGTVAIRASLNVTSITDNGAGDYTVNLTNALADTNYAVFALSNWDGTARGGLVGVNALRTKTTSAVPVSCLQSASYATLDTSEINVAIHR
jgi:hypothetical protein